MRYLWCGLLVIALASCVCPYASGRAPFVYSDGNQDQQDHTERGSLFGLLTDSPPTFLASQKMIEQDTKRVVDWKGWRAGKLMTTCSSA